MKLKKITKKPLIILFLIFSFLLTHLFLTQALAQQPVGNFRITPLSTLCVYQGWYSIIGLCHSRRLCSIWYPGKRPCSGLDRNWYDIWDALNGQNSWIGPKKDSPTALGDSTRFRCPGGLFCQRCQRIPLRRHRYYRRRLHPVLIIYFRGHPT